MATGAAFPASFSGQRVAMAVRAARTDEPLRPATLKQVFLTGLFGRVFNLKLAECSRKWRTRHPWMLCGTSNLKQPDKQKASSRAGTAHCSLISGLAWVMLPLTKSVFTVTF
jgi:hypothetical protein